MWNKLAEVFNDISYRRLGIAVVLSIIFHTFLFDGFKITLPIFNDDIKTIQARIQINKLKPVSIENPNQAAVTKEAPVKPSKVIEPPKVEEPSEPQNTVKASEQPSLESEKVSEEVASQPISDNQLPAVDADQQPSESNTAMSENAYQYVETNFDVRTEAEGSVQGFAKITHEVIDGHLYNLNFVIEPKGIAALFISNLVQTSKGTLTNLGLQPKTYAYLYGDKSEKARTANFDWVNKKIELITSKGSKIQELPDGTQDLLSFMYQFMYVPPLQQMQISIANGKKLNLYEYGFEGEEVLFLPIGEFRTIHIVHIGSDADEKTELWLAIDYKHIPVKIVKTEKEGRYYEFVATSISTTRPTTQ
jgi:Protein of unknown function (DUF3108)